MVGLVNSVGATEAGRLQSVNRRTEDTPERENGIGVPIPEAQRRDDTELASATEEIRRTRLEMQRRLPGGDESDRNAQADSEQQVFESLGREVDVTA